MRVHASFKCRLSANLVTTIKSGSCLYAVSATCSITHMYMTSGVDKTKTFFLLSTTDDMYDMKKDDFCESRCIGFIDSVRPPDCTLQIYRYFREAFRCTRRGKRKQNTPTTECSRLNNCNAESSIFILSETRR